MSYFTEIEGYETYAGKADDFHFIYNANSGGGQSFLGGKFRDADGNLVSPVSLDGRIGVFHFKSEGKSGVHDILLEDSSASYEIKPRATGDRNMKFSVGREKKPPSYTIAAFLMLPEPCGVEKSVSLDTSVLNSNNYWLQSMWLSVDTVTEDKAVLSVRDCVFGGGVDGDGHGDARYFSFDFNKRIADIITIAQNAALESEVSSCIKYFADVYTGQKPFVYNEARTAINSVMKYLSVKYPEEYSGTLDPLAFICELTNIHKSPELKSEPHQLITYGAPGTGKSFNIDKIVNDKGCVYFRTTFHPDSDYASFVGCYKPIVKEYDRIVALGKKIENAELDAAVPDELRKERKIEYTFVEQAFTKAYVAAWKNKVATIANGGQAAEPVYLIIEEINRGNCAQVFGDIFQLLDREGGFSKYPICADDDLRRHLEGVFKGLDFGSQYAKVQTGEELVLPDNLYIWATMNTSDQSLFPMDSAFKRRWDWEYVPISEGVDENTKQKLDWNIVVKDVEKQPDGTEKEVTVLYSWWQFLQIINTKIYHLTDSEDKELGYFFAKPDSAEGISAKLFVNKVVFYLWTDVYKNYGVDNIFKGSDNGATTEEEKAKGVPFRQFFDEAGKNANMGTLKNFFKAIGLKSSLPTA